jgi:hypothetical protein
MVWAMWVVLWLLYLSTSFRGKCLLSQLSRVAAASKGLTSSAPLLQVITWS